MKTNKFIIYILSLIQVNYSIHVNIAHTHGNVINYEMPLEASLYEMIKWFHEYSHSTLCRYSFRVNTGTLPKMEMIGDDDTIYKMSDPKE
jgi:asparagine synthetase A